MLEQALNLFPCQYFAKDTIAVETAFRNLADIEITELLDFQEFMIENGAPPSATGPDIQALMSKPAMHASLGRQRKRTQQAQRRRI